MQLDHAETAVLSALIASYPRPFSAARLISDGLPDFSLDKADAIEATLRLQGKRLVRFRRCFLSLTKAGESTLANVIAAVHSIH